MKPTLEQLNELSDYEINCAVAEKIEKNTVFTNKKAFGFSPNRGASSFEGFVPKDYCNDPRYYMPIAIEHDINIEFDRKRVTRPVSCNFWSGNFGSGFVHTGYFSKPQTGRAVCIAFLLMQTEGS